jgi:hypothetical protein
MDADDLMPRRLACQVAVLEADASLAAVGARVRIFPRRLAGRVASYERWLNAIDMSGCAPRPSSEAIVHPLYCARRVLVRTAARRGWPEDYDLVLRILASGHALGVVPEKLLAWRDGPARLSRTSAAYAQTAFTACKAEFLARGFLAPHARYALWGYGGTGRALARALAAHGKLLGRVIELHPRRLGQRIHGAPVVEPAALREAEARALPLIVSVAGATPRAEIRAELAELGYAELRDFVCAA